MASKELTCLLTGFDAFGTHKVNPTEVIVSAFPDIIDGRKQIEIRKVNLPTAGLSGWKLLKKQLNETLATSSGPVMVLMTGLAANRTSMSLERFAINVKDYRIADNSGRQPLDKPIVIGGHDLLRTSLDLTSLNKELTATGYPFDISNHAGTFVCNELYYQALAFAADEKRIGPLLFVHIPESSKFTGAASESKVKEVAARARLAKTKIQQTKLMSAALQELLVTVASKVN